MHIKVYGHIQSYDIPPKTNSAWIIANGHPLARSSWGQAVTDSVENSRGRWQLTACTLVTHHVPSDSRSVLILRWLIIYRFTLSYSTWYQYSRVNSVVAAGVSASTPSWYRRCSTISSGFTSTGKLLTGSSHYHIDVIPKLTSEVVHSSLITNMVHTP